MNHSVPAEKVWVAYATPMQQFHIEIAFESGMTVQQAIQKSGIEQHVQLPEHFSFGIFGVRIKEMDHVLEAGDRIEIYRALTRNPKDIRRKRAADNPTSRYCQGNRYRQLLTK